MLIEIFAAIMIGYFLGSIPFALVIGKLFYQTDIRNYGSKNLGGGNAGRVLGKKAGLSAAAGHCFPIFANFKGGKAVATMYGFLFGMALIGGYSFWIFFLPLIVFLAVLYLTKIVALGSIASAVANTVYIYFGVGSAQLFVASLVFTIVMIVRHRKNIDRIFKNEENKITWM